MAKRGRPTNTQRVIKQLSSGTVQKQTAIATDMFIPNHSGDHSAGHTETPTKNLDLVNKEYVDDITIGTYFDFYAYDDASDIGGYKEFKLTPSSGAEVEGDVSILGNATEQAVGARITEDTINIPDLMSVISSGIFTFHIHMRAAHDNRIKFFAKLYVRAAGGTETLICTTAPTKYITVAGNGYNSHGNITESVTLTAGDRLVVKGFASNNSHADTTLYIAIEGDTASRVNLPGITSPGHHESLVNLDYANAGHTGFSPDTHTIVSHDTDTTGAELTSLADNSMVDTLHRHSELSASDGSPDPALSVDTAGNVGIGTASPERNFEIEGSGNVVAIQTTNTGTGGLTWSTLSTNNNSGLGGGKYIIFDDTAGSARLTIDNTGNIGIGTNNPSTSLEINGTHVANKGLLYVKGISDHGYIYVDTDSPATKQVGYGWGNGAGGHEWLAYVSADTEDLRFYDTAARVTFQKGGNVGIGTFSPAKLLDINGAVQIFSASASYGAIKCQTGKGLTIQDDGGNGRIYFANGGDINLNPEGGTVAITGHLTTTGDIRTGGTYKSSGGASGVATQTETNVNNFDISIRDGLITSFTKNS